MHRTAVLLLQPTVRQQAALGRLLNVQRELYNAALEERIGVWRWERRTVTRFDQHRSLTGWPQEFGVWPARGTLLRLDRAFQAFFRRVKQGQTPGFPRFVSAGCRPRPVPDISPKTLVVRREGRGWRAYVVYEIHKPEPLAPTGRAVGVDLGVTHLAATSDGELVDNPRWFRRSAQRLADAQRKLASKQRGSNRRRDAVAAVARVHRKIRNQRRDAHHKLSRRLVDGGNRAGTLFRCRCGHTDHADINAARNILRADLAQRPAA